MTDQQFLQGIVADPGDTTLRLVYADWLEERADPRAEYLRLDVELASLPRGHEAAPTLRRRMLALRATVPGDWLANLGDHHVRPTKPERPRIDEVATLLERKVQYVDDEGYDRHIVAAARHPFSAALAYVECRSQQQGNFFDINYHLRLRDPAGREVARKVESYNPYFGCDVRFLEWYHDVVLMIYREKHQTYVCRFGFDGPALFRAIREEWIVSGVQLGYRNHTDKIVHRLSMPELRSLPSLTLEQAELWELIPGKR